MTSPFGRSSEWVLTQLSDTKAKIKSIAAQITYLNIELPPDVPLILAEDILQKVFDIVRAEQLKRREEDKQR